MNHSHRSRREFIRSASTLSAAAWMAPTLVSAQTASTKSYSKPALLGGEPIRKKAYPKWPMIEKIDEEKFLDSLRQLKWCRLYGDLTTQFENKWAESLGAKYVTAVVNGTNSLYAALNALDVGPGDEVLVPPYTFVATINAIFQQYALPVFVDIDPETYLIDPAKLESAITESTRCILPVHLGGNVPDMDRILETAKKHNLSVVEDACQAHFAEWKGKRVGGVGDIGCFSFQSSKILPCGEGGAIVTNREDLLDRFHAFQNNGRDRKIGTRNGYQYQGTNLRMTEFQAALLLAQLTRLENQCRLRVENAAHLTSLLKEIEGIHTARILEGCTRCTYYIYMLRYDRQHFSGLSRSRFIEALNKEGIPCGSGYHPLNQEPFIEKLLQSRAYRKLYSQKRLDQYRQANHCPENDRLCQEGIFISQECLLGDSKDVEQIAEAVLKIKSYAGELAKS